MFNELLVYRESTCSFFLFSFFRTIEEEARTATKWSEEMLDDFGVKELTWTKEKAQLDLENLNKAYKTLDEFDTSGTYLSLFIAYFKNIHRIVNLNTVIS